MNDSDRTFLRALYANHPDSPSKGTPDMNPQLTDALAAELAAHGISAAKPYYADTTFRTIYANEDGIAIELDATFYRRLATVYFRRAIGSTTYRATVNWPSIGETDPESAAAFGSLISAAAYLANALLGSAEAANLNVEL